ncbi:thioesterase II family protein [Streptomyces sp. NPDC020801]|uniref:thioesterase II family protein n=1 Tax=unclassified Streptomyces TaxID=2593676 RepID=UPI0037B06100
MTRKDPWVLELCRTRRAAAHVVLFPHAGGAATYYAPFARRLPGVLDVSAVQYPGRQDRFDEPFVTTVEGLADHVARSLRRYAGSPVPLVLFGHSMGASVAFETVVRLAAEGGTAPCRLIVSGRAAPSALRAGRGAGDTDEELLRRLAELGGTDPEIVRSPDLMDLFMPAIRNDYRAVELYRPTEHTVVDVPVLCLVGEQDPQVSLDEAASWKDHTKAEFRLRSYPGGHFFLLDHLAEVTRIVVEWAGSGNGGPAPVSDW